jgi:hypothetical protein
MDESFSIGNSEVTHQWNPYEPTIPEYDANNYNGSGQSTMIKRRRKFYANFSYAPSVSCPIIRGDSGGRGSDCIVAGITGKRKPKFFGGWRVQDLLENSRPCGAVVGLRAEPRSWSWLNDRRAELKVPQSYNKTEMALGLLLKWNRLTWKLGDMAYNSSETEKRN